MSEPKVETVRTLFESLDGEKSLFLTAQSDLGIVVGGNALVMSIERWHRLACKGFGTEFPPVPAQ